MPKTIRQRISRAIQTTFRSSSPHQQSSKTTACSTEKKPIDGGYIPYQFQSSPMINNYIDLSECHSSYLKDSGISSNENSYQLESTRIDSHDTSSFATISNISPVPTSFQCCRCQCHHYIDHNLVSHRTNYVYRSEEHLQKKVYPFIF